MPTIYTKDSGLGDFIVGQATGVGYNFHSSLGAQYHQPYKPPVVSRPPSTTSTYAPHLAAPYYVPPPRPLTEAEKKRQEQARARQARINARPSTAAYRKWWKRFSVLDDRVQNVASYTGGGAILVAFASFLVMAVWNATIWAYYAGLALTTASVVLVLSLFAMYVARMLKEYGAAPFRTWAGLADYGL
ncbi:MAG: hypothetical protein ACTS3R_04270 [Inquilinaceae bacterium]